MRKLASIKTISNLEPIQGADMIELAMEDVLRFKEVMKYEQNIPKS